MPGPFPRVTHPGWGERLPWLAQGTTARGEEGFDLRLFGEPASGDVLSRWRLLREGTGFSRAVHARQLHGTGLLTHRAGPAGLFLADGVDGHLTRAPGVLLTVSLADCVPVFLVDPEARAVALLHAGWRGIAAGIAGAGVEALASLGGGDPGRCRAHLGPSICGSCYEVGPEVHGALGLPVPDGPRPVDLRVELVRRLTDAGLREAGVSVTGRCTLCDGGDFYSHRGGDAGRQVAYVGIREEAPGS